jgi:hypothetical protein
VARLQNISTRAGEPGANRSLPILEPELEGEIAARSRLEVDRAAGATQASILGSAGAAQASSPAGVASAPVEVGGFERIEDYLRAYLEGERFRSSHALACGRWVVAWEMLWCADTRAKVIAVGQRARTAMLAFSSSMVERCAPLAIDANWPELLAGAPRRPEPVDGLMTITQAHRRELGEERFEILQSLTADWRSLLESVERHDRASRPVGERLRWEDGRRLVLFTGLVMVETDRSFA